jgi:hypothetical protein
MGMKRLSFEELEEEGADGGGQGGVDGGGEGQARLDVFEQEKALAQDYSDERTISKMKESVVVGRISKDQVKKPAVAGGLCALCRGMPKPSPRSGEEP